MPKILLAALILLAGCANREVVTKVETQRLTPPPALTEPVPQPPLRGDTIAGVIQTIPDLRGALKQCNGRLRDVREWANNNQEANDGRH